MATYQLNLKSSCKEAGRSVRGRATAVDEMRVRQSDNNNNKNNCKNNGNIKAKKGGRRKSYLWPAEDLILLEDIFYTIIIVSILLSL